MKLKVGDWVTTDDIDSAYLPGPYKLEKGCDDTQFKVILQTRWETYTTYFIYKNSIASFLTKTSPPENQWYE